MIRIEGLSILFETFKIMGLDITIEEKEFHSLLGPTGCGKTLILESIMGLRKPTKGKIWIGEREVQTLPPERREISYVPQDLALFPHLNVRENIFYGIKARNLDKQVYEDYVRLQIQEMKVGHLLERYPANLSGGEKKRVALLRALASKPKLLLLDEPVAGMNARETEELLVIISKIREMGITILLIDHDMKFVMGLCDRLWVLNFGRKIAEGTPLEIQRNESVLEAYLGREE